MLTYDLKIAVDQLNTFIASSPPFIEALDRLVLWHRGFNDFIEKIAAGSDKIQTIAGNFHSHIGSTSSTIREIDAEGFFESSTDLSNLLRRYFPIPDGQEAASAELIADIASIRKLFSSYVVHQSPTNALPLLVAASAFSLRLKSFQQDANYFVALLIPAISRAETENELSIIFYSDQSVNSFWSKLKAVEDLYRTLSHLLGINPEEHPLRIIKIESGSQLINLLGSAGVIALISKFLAEPIKFLYRNYTTEGRIASALDHAQKVNAIVRVLAGEEMQNVDTARQQERYGAVALTIAENLNDLLSHESRFIFGEREVNTENEGSISLMSRLQLKRTNVPRLDAPPGNTPLLGNTPSNND